MERQRRRLRSIDLQNRGFHSGMRMQPAPIIRLII
jgi:hypothetical protein